MNEQERQRLKEQYKDHYKRIREAKQQLRQAQRQKSMTDAIRGMNANDLFDVFDEMMHKIKHKITSAEARLEVALDDLEDDDTYSAENAGQDKVSQDESEEVVRRQRAKDTIRQVKAEMGMLYTEIEKRASEIAPEKTVGQTNRSREDEKGTTQ
jgi:phage shock protein A